MNFSANRWDGLFRTLGRGTALFLAAVLCFADSAGSRPEDVTFVDVAQESGIGFRHDNAASPEKYLIETMGSGAAWLDFDQDGLLDVYLVNSAATAAYTPSKPLRNSLYQNQGAGVFKDVATQAGVTAEGLFGTGTAVGDYDNDGDPDLFVTGFPRSILYRNQGDGTFTDVSEQAGGRKPRQVGIERRLVRL